MNVVITYITCPLRSTMFGGPAQVGHMASEGGRPLLDSSLRERVGSAADVWSGSRAPSDLRAIPRARGEKDPGRLEDLDLLGREAELGEDRGVVLSAEAG